MARTFVRQDTQIRRSDVYTDTTAPTEANYETNPANIEDDLNSLRSMVHTLLKRRTGNWWDDLTTPVTFTGEGETQRAVDDLNVDLHDLERKRVLVKAVSLADVTVGADTAATATLTSAGAFSDTETVTIGSTVYTFRTPFVNAAFNIDASGTVAQTHENLRRAINGDGVAGTNYGTGTTVHPDVTAIDTATTNVITAKKSGTFANGIATTETGANISWGGATMSGGAGGDVAVLGTGELPPNTTAAVGAVTTLGTVLVSATSFLTASLDLLSGSTAISPKNFVEVVDGTTRDPILDGADRIYGLLQGESGVTDGATITDTTTTRVQVTFVKISPTGDSLVTIDGAALGGTDVNLCFTERKALADLTEQDFLRGAIVDVPGAGTVTRQVAYDNQGTVPVDQTTNATLDLEGAGLYWEIRDDLEARLFAVIEGSGGSSSTIEFGTNVDTFDNNAAANDFATGATINSTGTRPIAIGETDGVIESTAGDLRVNATLELYLDDGNQTGSTWAQTDGIKLSDTTAEWDLFETNFGEVSLLNAINQAIAGDIRSKVQAVVTVTTAADSDVNLATYANVDTQLPAYDTVTFVDDVEVFVNGILQRNGANAAANEDVYPGTSPAVGDLRFEYQLKATGNADVITVIVNGQ
jgi:hypothetical protein